ADRNRSHWRTSKTPSYTKSVSWQHHPLKLLEAKGQKVALKEAMGSTQSIMVGPDGELYGASDPRSVDDLTAGY
ncbi:hypothetical protein, partial [Escherichia coli]|uniref:hypothetical protein n=1 Tax=Escherichia coli TaxID=562 RepID=UPI00157099CC